MCLFVCGSVSEVQTHSCNYCSAVYAGICNACLLLCNTQQCGGGELVPGDRR